MKFFIATPVIAMLAAGALAKNCVEVKESFSNPPFQVAHVNQGLNYCGSSLLKKGMCIDAEVHWSWLTV